MADIQLPDSSVFPSTNESIANSKRNVIIYSEVSLKHYVDGVLIQSPVTVFEKYLPILKQNSVFITISNDNFYHPEFTAKRLYGTSDLWWLLLMLNNMSSHKEYNKREILALQVDQKTLISDILELEKRNLIRSKETPLVIEDLTLFPINVY